MIALTVYKTISVALIVGLIGTSGAAVYYYRQQGTDHQTVLQDANLQDSNRARISDLTSQISSLNKQVDALNSQIAQLQALNIQLGGTNTQLATQIQQLQSQVSQLQSQVSLLQARLTDLTEKLRLQQSRVIANAVCIYADCPSGAPPYVGNQAFINLGSIPFSGYLRVSWTGAHVRFSVQVFDVDITTPIVTSGIYSVPVSANATGNAWFTGYDCTQIASGTWCPPTTYSMTYWY
jgi:outer membrane murein-binding lipoprotein Lpp